jgi:hypothetical protein
MTVQQARDRVGDLGPDPRIDAVIQCSRRDEGGYLTARRTSLVLSDTARAATMSIS